MYDIVALGELLIDFTPAGVSPQGNPLYEQNPGGAPANVLAAATRLGRNTALISAVGSDAFGRFLIKTMQGIDIDISGMQVTEKAPTTLVFICLDAQGNRSFTFVRNPGADQMLAWDKMNTGLLENCRIFHFGSISLSREPARDCTLQAAQRALRNGALVSYDPNWRPLLWDSEREGVAEMKRGFALANLIKLSEEELQLLSGTDDLEQGTDFLFSERTKLIAVTLGPRGCFYRTADSTGFLPTYDTKVTDTTGSGDAFWGAALSRILEEPACLLPGGEQVLREALDFANAAGAYCASGRGAIPSIPDLAQIERVRAQVKLLG